MHLEDLQFATDARRELDFAGVEFFLGVKGGLCVCMHVCGCKCVSECHYLQDLRE